MNVYVESNFVLELAFEQEQHQFCQEVLELCDEKKVNLILPAYCLAEPLEKIVRQARDRSDLQKSLNTVLLQLSRTSSYASRLNSIQDIESLLVQSNEEEKQRFARLRDRLVNVAEIIPLTLDTIREAAMCEATYDLTPQDAIVFASVITHLRQNGSSPSCFLNRNSKDFDNPDIVTELSKSGCKMIPRFDNGVAYIQSCLRT